MSFGQGTLIISTGDKFWMINLVDRKPKIVILKIYQIVLRPKYYSFYLKDTERDKLKFELK